MTNSSDVLEVGGNAYFEGCAGNSSGTTEGYLTQGELRLSGNFQRTSPYGDCTRRSFVSTGTTVVFEKNGTQSVSFADASASYSYFKHVRVAASSTVNFNNTTYSKGDVDVYGHLHGQSGTDTVTGNMTLRDGSTLTNTSSTFTGLSGCTKESGHTINGTDPCP